MLLALFCNKNLWLIFSMTGEVLVCVCVSVYVGVCWWYSPTHPYTQYTQYTQCTCVYSICCKNTLVPSPCWQMSVLRSISLLFFLFSFDSIFGFMWVNLCECMCVRVCIINVQRIYFVLRFFFCVPSNDDCCLALPCLAFHKDLI